MPKRTATEALGVGEGRRNTRRAETVVEEPDQMTAKDLKAELGRLEATFPANAKQAALVRLLKEARARPQARPDPNGMTQAQLKAELAAANQGTSGGKKGSRAAGHRAARRGRSPDGRAWGRAERERGRGRGSPAQRLPLGSHLPPR